MAASVILLSEDGKSREKVKPSAALCLVRQLLAIEVSKKIYRRVKAHGQRTSFVDNPYIPFGLEPSIDARIGVIVAVPALPNQIRYRSFR